MSRTTVYALVPGQKEIRQVAEFSNSWGSGPFVWQTLSRRYLDRDFTTMSGTHEALLRLAYDPDADLPVYERAVLMMTFDHAYVRRANFRRAASDIRAFSSPLPGAPADRVANHWPAIADLLDLLEKGVAHAIGLHLTSVSENPWQGDWNEERSEHEGPNWKAAFEVYDEVDQARARELLVFQVAREVAKELLRAMRLHPPMHSGHEGKAIIEEELDELWKAVKCYPRHDMAEWRKEALHVAAMGLRFMLDVCDNPDNPGGLRK